MFKKILVPLDGSALSQVALTHAVDLARQTGGEVFILRARIAPASLWVGSELVVPPALTQFQEYELPMVLEYLEGIKAKLKADGFEQVTMLTPTGQAAEAILDAADEHEIDLIVMSSHGRSGMERWLVGSVAERVVRHAPCPTMVISGRSLKMVEEAEKMAGSGQR